MIFKQSPVTKTKVKGILNLAARHLKKLSAVFQKKTAGSEKFSCMLILSGSSLCFHKVLVEKQWL